MKTEEQIKIARQRLCERLQTPGLNDAQRTLLQGMLNALVWAADGSGSQFMSVAIASTMDRLLSDEPIAAGKDPRRVLEGIETFAATGSSYVCPQCGPMAHSRLRGLYCITCR